MLNKITNWFAKFFELQLVISLISLPLLMKWGLAISYMAPVANLLFTPLLSAFLWCSCIITFCSILHIPCSGLNNILYFLDNVWHYLLSYSNPTWLIGFPLSMFGYAATTALLIFLLYIFIKPTTNIAIVILCSCIIFLYGIKAMHQQNSFEQISTLPLHLFRAHGKTYLIDSGALCKKQNFYAWIDYTILPTLIKQTGTTTIDSLFLYKPSKRLVQVATQFAQQTNTKHIFITKKQSCYENLKNEIMDTPIKIHPIEKIKNNI